MKPCYRAYVFVALLLLVSAGLSQAQDKKKLSGGKAILWERVNVSEQDLYYGPGGREMQPDLSRITFVREEKGGYSKKYRIKDGSGNTWVAKIGKEAQSETAAVRLISALGYKTEINYLVPSLTIPGKGTFTNVRLEARPEWIDRGKEWRWDRSPFAGTRPLKGLLLMMAFLNNWDIKNANNVILNTDSESWYAISDLGVSFGKGGIHSFPLLRWIGRSRNKPTDFAKSRFITKVDENRVKVHFTGKNPGLMKFTTADARWLGDLLKQLSDRQIRDAFRAANYSSTDINLLTNAVRSRIEQLDRAGVDKRLAGAK